MGRREPLPDDEVDRRLAELPGWRHESGEIYRWLRFGGFPQAMAFLQALVEPCERLNHHPDVESHYDRVRIGLHTWNANAITELDLELASEIDAVAAVAAAKDG